MAASLLKFESDFHVIRPMLGAIYFTTATPGTDNVATPKCMETARYGTNQSLLYANYMDMNK